MAAQTGQSKVYHHTIPRVKALDYNLNIQMALDTVHQQLIYAKTQLEGVQMSVDVLNAAWEAQQQFLAANKRDRALMEQEVLNDA